MLICINFVLKLIRRLYDVILNLCIEQFNHFDFLCSPSLKTVGKKHMICIWIAIIIVGVMTKVSIIVVLSVRQPWIAPPHTCSNPIVDVL